MNLVKPRAIFFDIGNTLVTGTKESARRLLAARLGLSEKETRRMGRLIMTHPALEPTELTDAICRRLAYPDRERMDAAVTDIWRTQRECVRVIPGAVAIVRRLKGENYKIGVISNTWHPAHEGFLDACQEIIDLFDYKILSYRLAFKKPSLEPFLEGLRLCGEPAENCWMIGDSLELDVYPAQSAGMKALWVMTRPEREKDLLAEIVRGEKRSPDWTVASLDEILPFFGGLKDS